MIVGKTGGNPNVYGNRWNKSLGCVGCGLGRIRPPGTGLGDVPMLPLLIAFVGFYFLPKLMKKY